MENTNKDLKKIIKIALAALLFIIIGGYTYYKTKDILRGVALEVNGIEDGQVFEEPLVTISGSAENSVKISIDDREIFIDKEANFEEKILLMPGYNILTVKAEDRFGKKIQKNYQLTLIN